MRKWLLFGLSLLMLLLSACDNGNPQDFYSVTCAEGATVGPVCTFRLGMTHTDLTAAALPNADLSSDLNTSNIFRLVWQKDTLQSITFVTKRYQPVGIPFTSTRDDLLVHYALDPDVTVSEQPNLLFATKTINGTDYYVRYVLYDDGTIKEITVTTDLTLDPPQMPTSSS